MSKPRPNHIGVMQEMSLHAALKAWYAQPGDQLEMKVDGYVVDIVRDGGAELIEIQTRNFSAMRRKLAVLTRNHHVRLVYPVPVEKWIVRLAPDEQTELSRRRSPKRGQVTEIFRELPGIARFVADPNFTIEVLLIRAEEVLCTTRGLRRASWRRKGWCVHDRRLIEVVDRRILETPADFRAFLPVDWLDAAAHTPPSVAEPRETYATAAPPRGTPGCRAFTTRDIAGALGLNRFVAQKMAYCLREMGAINIVGRQGNAFVYSA